MSRLFALVMDTLLRRFWIPRVGDRVEFLLTPHWHQDGESVIESGDCATIARLIENSGYTHKLDVVFAMDDGREIKVDFFKWSSVRVIGFAGVRKHA